MHDVSEILKSAYKRRKKAQSAFNLVYLSKKLGVSAAFLSQLFSGKRAVPARIASDLCKLLDLDPDRRDLVFKAAIGGRRAMDRKGLLESFEGPSGKLKSVKWIMPAAGDFWLLEKPIYLVILNCCTLNSYDGSEQFFSKVLDESPEEINDALARLRRAGFLSLKEGRYSRTDKFYSFSSSTNREKLRAYHRQGLKFVNQSLLKKTSDEDAEERLVNTAVITLPRSKVVWAKQRIMAFMEEMVAELTAGEPEEIYHIGMQLVPITKTIKEEREESLL